LPERETYLSIDAEASAEFRDRGSRFIAYAFPVKSPDEMKQRLRDLKKEHPKAVHHCFAYRMGYEGEQYRAVDDGEPSGTAGLPILGQLDSRRLSFTAVVVVRYFGGTLLGKPGLINAYKSAASMALQAASTSEKTIDIRYSLNFNYTQLDEVMGLLKKVNVSVQEKEIELFCRMIIAVPISKADIFEKTISEIYNVEINKLI
jgi:uncharacterized YigZ family protein